MDDEVIRIVVFTDSHLGFQEKDPVRGDDSFAAYEEAFHFAAREKADFVLHAGDMFHENRPSRRTLHSAMTVLRKYCFGDAPVRIEVLNDQKEVFKQNGGVVNYESPYQSISLPVFAIHGNHDDISREAGSGATLSALDLMAVSNFVNYFGKSEQVDDILISPILIRKKGTNIALYGLGAMRDERLNRMWMQKKVRFSQPPNAADYFNILVLHQNRDYGRGRKNCIHESMIPEWMDLVIWGNEHECIPNLQESLVGTYRIYQPGSSVATSFSEGESRTHPKSIGLIQIKQKKFKLRVESFTQIRPFIYGEMKLSDYSPGQIQAASPKEEDQIKAVLKQKIESMIGEARGEAEKISSAAAQKKLTFRVKDPGLVLIRLRCDHAGFTSINPSRFGSTFVGKVANASDMVAFSKKTVHQGRAVEKAGGGGGGGGIGKMGTVAEQMKQALADGEEDAVHKIKIEDLVAETLVGKSKLQLIREEDMAQALEDYVARKNLSAITDAITAELENCQEKLWKNDALDNPTRESIVEAAQSVVKGRAAGEKRAAAPKARPKALEGEDEDEIVDDDDEGAGAGAGKKKPAAKRAPAAKKAPAAAKAKAPAKSRAKPKAKDDYEGGGHGDDFMDGEEDPPTKGRGKKASVPTPSRKSGRAVKQMNYASDDDDDEDDEGSVEEVRGLDDEDDDDDEEVRAPPLRTKKPPAAAKPASKPAPQPKSKSSDVVDLCSDNEDIDDDDDDQPRTNQSKATMFSATSAVDDSGALAPSGPSQATKKRALPASLTGSSTAAKKKPATSKLSDWE
jgi:double-strand break repair protein MRE11